MATRCLCALAALLAVASAQGSEEGAGGAGEESLGDYASQFEEAGNDKAVKIGPHPDVKAAYVFPDFVKPRFPMGENVDMLVAFHNTGKKAFTLTSISGTLNSPYDFSFIVQNVRARAPCCLCRAVYPRLAAAVGRLTSMRASVRAVRLPTARAVHNEHGRT